MCDLDGLKNINDTQGHLAGDRAIAAVAEALKSTCPEDAICVRFGGDEMLAFIMGDCECDSIIAEIREKLVAKGIPRDQGIYRARAPDQKRG